MANQRRGIILLEGPDCSGKTTLAKHLVDEHGARYIHCRRDRNIWRLQTGALRLAAKWAEKQVVVLDRHWISECIYGQVFREGPAFGAAARSMRRMLERFGTLTVLCVPPVDYVVAEHAKRHATGGEAFDTVREVAVRYTDLLHGSIIRPLNGDHVEELSARGGVGLYDLKMGGQMDPGWAHYDLARVMRARSPRTAMAAEAKVILNRLDKVVGGIRPFFYNTALHNLAGRVSYADRGQPLAVLIGTRASDEHCAVTWPFYATKGAAASLNQHLQRAGIPEHRIAIVDGWAAGGLVTLTAIKKMRPEARFIALGDAAAKSVDGAIKLSCKIRPPQPFFAHNDYSYKKELRDAILGA